MTRQPFLREKAGPKNLSCLWQALIGRSDPQALIYRGLHNTALLLYRYHKVKARSGTKAAACSNRYATDKRGARCAQIRIYRDLHIVQLWIFSWERFLSNSFF